MDTKGALAKYAILAADPESPDSLKRRAQAMTDFLKGGGAVAYGTVPAPVRACAQRGRRSRSACSRRGGPRCSGQDACRTQAREIR